KRARKILLSLIVTTLAFPAWPQHSLPAGTRWLDHLNKELLPFWTTDTSFGTPFGAFPGTRCDDATLYDERSPCPEIRRNAWISPQQRHVVALSRQVYGYGVAFHLTGKRAYLDAMKAGIDFIRQNAMDRVNGGMATTQNISDGSWVPAPRFRNSQELGYALLGMAFYYYLVRDADVVQDILAVKNYIFDKYYNPSLGAMQWMLTSSGGVSFDDKRLAAQLDQMNTYLVLLTPMLPEPFQSEWKASLLQLCHVMIDQFYSPGEPLFFLSRHAPGRQGTDNRRHGLWPQCEGALDDPVDRINHRKRGFGCFCGGQRARAASTSVPRPLRLLGRWDSTGRRLGCGQELVD